MKLSGQCILHVTSLQNRLCSTKPRTFLFPRPSINIPIIHPRGIHCRRLSVSNDGPAERFYSTLHYVHLPPPHLAVVIFSHSLPHTKELVPNVSWILFIVYSSFEKDADAFLYLVLIDLLAAKILISNIHQEHEVNIKKHFAVATYHDV